jgi:glutaredoxin 3
MSKIRIYTTPICPYCMRAKALLAKKGIPFDEIDVYMDGDARDDMQSKANGAYTVPQIFIGDRHVGGCEELYALDKAGELDPLLAK